MTTQLSTMTEAEHREYRVRKESIKQSAVGIAEDLKYIRDNQLYREEYGTFEEFVAREFDKTRQWAYNLIGHAAVIENVNHGLHQIPERQTRELGKLPDEEQSDAYAEATEKAEKQGKQKPTTKDVKETVQRRKAANGGEYKPPKPELVGPDPKEFHKHYGPLVRHLSAMDKHYKTDVFNGLVDDMEPVLKRYNGLVKEFA